MEEYLYSDKAYLESNEVENHSLKHFFKGIFYGLLSRYQSAFSPGSQKALISSFVSNLV